MEDGDPVTKEKLELCCGTTDIQQSKSLINFENGFNNNNLEPLVISALAMSVMLGEIDDENIYDGMIDAGANTSLGPMRIALALNAVVYPHLDTRTIGTANSDGILNILGWIFINDKGYTGPIAIVDKGTHLLLSTRCMQDRGMTTTFPLYTTLCELSTVNGLFKIIERCNKTQLYFIDVRLLLEDYMTPFVRQFNDSLLCLESLVGGWAGTILFEANGIMKPQTRRISPLIRAKVWELHKKLLHPNMLTVAADIDAGRIINASVTPADIRSVVTREHCLACAMSKWNRLLRRISTNIKNTRIGHTWSMDYIGPYATVANGGFTGEFVCIEGSCGYIVVFLVKFKTEAVRVITELNQLNRRFGHRMEIIRVDFGSVENGAEFMCVCANLNAMLNIHGSRTSTTKPC